MDKTAHFIKELRKRIAAAAVIEEIIGSGLATLTFFLIFAVIDFVFLLPARFVRVPVYVAFIAVAYAAVRVAMRCRPSRLSDDIILVTTQQRVPELGDEPLSAWQLSRKRDVAVSGELIEALTGKVEDAIAALDVSRIQPFATTRSRKSARLLLGSFVVFAALYALPPHIANRAVERIAFSLSSSSWDRYYSLAPGDRSLPFGSPAEIAIERKRVLGGEPVLRVRMDNGGWRKAVLVPAGGRYVFAVDQVCGKISYCAEWSDIESPVFALVPVMYPQLGDFSVTLQYPDYTGLAPQEIKGSGAITALAGTRVTLRARSTKELKGAALRKSWEGGSWIGAEGDRLTARFTLSESGTYRIEAEAVDGTRDPDPAEFPVSVTKDAPPQVELLSPAEDLVVSPQEEIPLVGEARDDFGLRRIELVYRIDDQKERRLDVVVPEDGVSQKSFEYLWRVGELNARPGARIRYYLEAWDNDTHAGPKPGATSTRLIEITDYEREHDAIENDLRGVKEKLLGILADQNAVRERTKPLETVFSTAAFAAALEGQRAVKTGMQEPVDRLKRALARMENDPLTDLGTLGEYRGLASYLERLSNGPMTDAPQAIEGKDFARAGRDQDEIIASLEKLSLLSEDIWQDQKMRDVLDAGSELKDASARLKERLAEGTKPEDLKAALDRIEELMGKISRQLSKFPKELPEDFVNSPAVKQIPMGTYEDQAKRLREALDRGDWKTAKELAAQLAEGLEDMLNTMEEAGKNSGFSSGPAEEMRKRVQEYDVRLGEIRQKQSALQQRIEEMDAVREKALFAEQEKMLGELARRQKELTGRAEALKGRALPRVHVYLLTSLDQSIALMRKVLEEFSEKRVFHSQKYLEDVIALLADQGRMAAAGGITQDAEFRKSFGEEIDALSSGEKEILDALRKAPEKDLFSTGQKEDLKGLAGKETELSGETDAFRKSLEEFTRRSTALDAGIFDNVQNASREMKSAGEALGGSDTRASREHGQKALDYLSEMQKSLGAAGAGLAERSGGAGKPQGGRVRVMGGSGATGFRSMPVKLPRINEYKPPREFRQEILDALKEKYPKQYEKIIKEYFKRLTE